MTRDAVVAEARRWLGTPFRPAGRSARGLDCIGLLVMVGRALDVAHEDHAHYTQTPDPDLRLLAEFDRWLDRCRPADPYPGTIGVFRQARLPCHVGIFSHRHGVVHLIHAMAARRAVIEEPWLPAAPHAGSFGLTRRFRFRALED